MSLLKQIEADQKQAMKDRNELKLSCLRLMSNAMKVKAKDLLRALSPEEETQTLKTLLKQRREAIEMFQKGGRTDLAAKEEAELTIIESYLPAQMNAAAIEAVLNEVFAALNPQGPQDMGKVMKETMTRIGAQADGKLVNELVRRRFA